MTLRLNLWVVIKCLQLLEEVAYRSWKPGTSRWSQFPHQHSKTHTRQVLSLAHQSEHVTFLQCSKERIILSILSHSFRLFPPLPASCSTYPWGRLLSQVLPICTHLLCCRRGFKGKFGPSQDCSSSLNAPAQSSLGCSWPGC